MYNLGNEKISYNFIHTLDIELKSKETLFSWRFFISVFLRRNKKTLLDMHNAFKETASPDHYKSKT